MKIKILTDVTRIGTELFPVLETRLFKNRIYNAVPAFDIKNFASPTKHGPKIKKVYVEKDGVNYLVERENFQVVEATPEEADEIIVFWMAARTPGKRAPKTLIPQKLRAREGFEEYTEEKQLKIGLASCQTKRSGELCGREAKLIRTNLNKSFTVCCIKCGTIPANMPTNFTQ